jgi:DNA replication licensing factor MCM2
MILKMSKDERIAKRLIKSIAPSIYGRDDIKTCEEVVLLVDVIRLDDC